MPERVAGPAGGGHALHGASAGEPSVPGLIDTHCHLDLLHDTEGELAAATAAGLEAVVAIGFDLGSSRAAAAFARDHASVFACVGLYPHEADTLDDAVLAGLEKLAREPKVVAIGECGFDYYHDRCARDVQRRAFSAQIELARRTGLTLVVHTRDAADDTLAILDDEAAGLTVVLHCFSLPERVDECAERGYYQSFAGNVTYKNAAGLRAAAARVRDDLLLVETDAPYLTPVPHRGKPNRPVWVAETAAVVAEARGWTHERTAAVTTANARRAFGLPARR
jgi:TatD DNase family protein